MEDGGQPSWPSKLLNSYWVVKAAAGRRVWALIMCAGDGATLASVRAPVCMPENRNICLACMHVSLREY